MKPFVCALLAALALFGCARAEGGESELLALMTFGGTQSGGEEAACIDRQGGIYYVDLEAEGLRWRGEETLELLRSRPEKYRTGQLSEEAVGDLLSRVDALEGTALTQYGVAACDAGVLRVSAFRGGEEIPLLTAGDTVSENVGREAVALSAMLLEAAPQSRRLCRWKTLFPYGDSVPISFSLESGSFFGGARAYTLSRLGDHVLFEARGMNGDETLVRAEFDDAQGFFEGEGVFSRLQEILLAHDVAAWDGFSGWDEGVLDGDCFAISVDYGSSALSASGCERYPEGYGEALAELESLFAELTLRAGEEAAE